MKKLTLLVGPSGSGKTTFARNISGPLSYINQDEQGKLHLKFFNDSISSGDNIVIDRLNFNKEQRNRYLVPAKEAGYFIEIVVFHETYEICLSRCLKRKNHPTIKDQKSASSALHTFFSKYERVEDIEADVVSRIYPNTPKQLAIWIDVDNTLADSSRREHYLKGPKKDWDGFFSDAVNDPVNEWCKQLIIGMKDNVEILICSARSDKYRKITEQWLGKNNIPYDELIMRRRNDFRRDDIVKEIMLEFEIKPRFNLLFSVDDRKQVIDKIRTHGVTVLDCAGEKGNF